LRIALVFGLCAAATAVARADVPKPPPVETEPAEPPAPAVPAEPSDVNEVATPGPPRRIVGFAVRGDSKVRPRTLGYLSHTEIGDLIGPDDLPRIQQALLSSELFETVTVTLEPAPGAEPNDVIVVATCVDKLSWIVAPTAFALPGNLAFGAGYVENDFRGTGQKYLLYGQIGTQTSLFFGTFLDPAYHGTKLTWRTDLYAYRRMIREYENPPDNPRSVAIARTTTTTYLSAGALIGWNFLWWLVGDLRLRFAHLAFHDARDASGQAVAHPEKDGWDITVQMHLTLDHRHHRFGVTWGSYVQLHLEPSLLGVDSYGYQYGLLRAYHSWRLFEEHELELRAIVNGGRHLPLHEEVTLGGAGDLRGYNVDQFRGDTRAVFRGEYSVPLLKWRFFAFRGIGFVDTGYVGFHNRRADRDYLPNQRTASYVRSDVGAGLRIYLNNIVLPLLGLDLGYGIEGHSPQIYFEVGLTDF
jgi:outer membrane protein assembly factor BamA